MVYHGFLPLNQPLVGCTICPRPLHVGTTNHKARPRALPLSNTPSREGRTHHGPGPQQQAQPPRPRRSERPARARQPAPPRAPQAGRSRSRARPSPARGVSPRQPRRHGGPRLGAVRLRLRLRRRLRGPPQLWHVHHHAHPGGPRLQGGRDLPAGLARPQERCRPGRAPPGLSRLRRQHGLHGQPLHRGQAPPRQGLLHPRGRHGGAPGPRLRGLLKPHQAHVQARGHRAGRHRGEPAPPCPLRLLVRLAQALHPA